MSSIAIHLPKKRRYLPPHSYETTPPSPPEADLQMNYPACPLPDSRTSPAYFNNNVSPSSIGDYYPIRVKDEIDLRVPHNFSTENAKPHNFSTEDLTVPHNFSRDEVRRTELEFRGGLRHLPQYEDVRSKVEPPLPLDLTVTSSDDRDCSSTMSSNASIGDYSNSNSMEINSTSADLHSQDTHEASDSDHQIALVSPDGGDSNRPHSTKRESSELKLMKKNIEKYIDTNRDFQKFRAKILGDQPSFSNSNMKRYKNNPYEVYDEDYLKKREKNNLSAQKCREKRNLHEKTNVCLSHYLIVDNTRLNEANDYLTEANKQLKLQLEMINNFIKFGPMGK